MISISTIWSSIEVPGTPGTKEREREPESIPMLMARVAFSNEHFLPINYIPGRIFGMPEDQSRVFGKPIPYTFKGGVKYDNDMCVSSALYRDVVFVGTDMAVFATGEEREDPDEGLMTVIDIPFFQFSIPRHIFLDVDKLKRDLVRHAKACGTPLSPDQIEKLATLKKCVDEIEARFT